MVRGESGNSLDDIDKLLLIRHVRLLKKLLAQVVAARSEAESLGPVKDGVDEEYARRVGVAEREAVLPVSFFALS